MQLYPMFNMLKSAIDPLTPFGMISILNVPMMKVLLVDPWYARIINLQLPFLMFFKETCCQVVMSNNL